MRFMLMHKNDPNTEAGLPPPLELVHKMGAFIGGYAQTGRLLDGAGLGASQTRTRLVFRGGRSTTKHGPYAGEHELPASMLLLKVRTREDALGWAERYGKILGDGELEVGKVNEAWDIGLMPAPENPPLQMLLIDKGDARTEGSGRSPQTKAAISRLKTEMTKAGESKELIGGFALLELSGVEEAIETCRGYAEILGGTLEIDLRVVAEPEPD